MSCLRPPRRVLSLLGLFAGVLAVRASAQQSQSAATPHAPLPRARAAQQVPIPEWRRGATCYEVFVRSFYDGDGDGIGDFKGLTQKLDYINDGNPNSTRSLGARCIWLMPIASSPSYHGYDVSDYYRVARDYGTTADFQAFITAAHRRGIRVLVDMVLNHASSRHPYFMAASTDTSSPYRNWFRFSATKPAQKGPWGQEVWHKSAFRDEYYYGVFTAEMPDLNYATPAVRAEAANVARFWLDSMHVDGFRLDAVPYLVEEGGQLMGTRGTHQVLHDYAAAVRQARPGAFTVGEVFDSIGAQLPYYPDQLDDYFSFEVGDSLLSAVRSGRAAALYPPILRLQKAVPPDRFSPFQRNHDQPRTMTVLGGDVGRARLAATLLLTLPGLPFVYYGEELGAAGDKPDERMRTPMAWSRGSHAGFTSAAPWEPLQTDSMTANVGAQDTDPRSMLTLYRRLIHLRAANPVLDTGELIPLTTSNDAVAAYVRREGNRAMLVVANLGATPASQVTLSSSTTAVAAGRHAPRTLLSTGADAATAAPLTVASDGRIVSYTPMATLPPQTAYVFELP